MDLSQTIAGKALEADRRSRPWQDIDLDQCKVLLSIYLKQALRPAPNESRRGRRPLVTLAISMSIMGVCFSASRRYAADVPTYFVGLFTAVLLIVITGVIPQTQELRTRDSELLYSKPISSHTLTIASILVRLFYAWLLATSFSLIPFTRAALSFEAGIGVVAGTYVALLLAGFSAIVLWTSVATWVSSRVGLETYRKAIQSINLICLLVLMVPSIIAFASNGPVPVEPVSLESFPIMHYFPPAWFATFFSSGLGQGAILERLGALLIAGAAVAIALSPRASRRYLESMERASAIDQAKPKTPLGLKIASWIHALPVVGKWLIPEQTLAVMAVLLSTVQREEQSRLRMLSSRIMLAAFAVWCFISPSAYLLLVVTGFGYATVTDGTETLKRCSQPGGAWLLRSSPLPARNLEQGIRLSVLVNYFLLPGLLTTVVLFRVQQPLTAVALALTFFAMAGLLASLMTIVAPAIPLTQEMTRAPISWTTLAGWTFNATSAVVYLVLLFLFRAGPFGAVAFMVGFLVLCGACYTCAILAGNRLSGLEGPA